MKSLEPFGCQNLPLAIQASGSILKYVKRNRKNSIIPITKLTTYSSENHMILDKQTSNNLEVFHGGRDNNQKKDNYQRVDYFHWLIVRINSFSYRKGGFT